MTTPFDNFKDSVREHDVRFCCVSQIKDEMGNRVERWQAIKPGTVPISLVTVIDAKSGCYSLYLETGGIKIDDDVTAVLNQLKGGA